MIDKAHPLPITRQAQLLGLSRASVYYLPQPTSEADVALRRRLDELPLAHPFAGARMLRDLLRQEGHPVGCKHIATLMRQMGIEALYRRTNTSRRHPQHPVFPYLLRHLVIEQPNQAWGMDITYVPMKRGFVYLAAVLDWATCHVLAWQLSNTLTTDFCLEAVEEAIVRYGRPEIFNTDQGCQFTSEAFVGLLQHHGIRLSRDGRGCWRDNVFVERLWKTVKYEEVYLHAYASVPEAKQSLTRYFAFYNQRRPHSSLDGQTPDAVYFNSLPQQQVA